MGEKPMTSQTTRKNGCVFTECIVELPCERKVVPKDRKTFCVYMVTKTKRNAIPQKRVGGKQSQ